MPNDKNILRDTYVVYIHRRESGLDTVRQGEYRKVFKYFVEAVRGKCDAVVCYFTPQGEFSVLTRSDAFPYDPCRTLKLIREKL